MSAAKTVAVTLTPAQVTQLRELVNAHQNRLFEKLRKYSAANRADFAENYRALLKLWDEIDRALRNAKGDDLVREAAPEMFAALQAIRAAYPDAVYNPTGGLFGRAWAKVDDAIDKALGRSFGVPGNITPETEGGAS